jgi:hypothetical protein
MFRKLFKFPKHNYLIISKLRFGNFLSFRNALKNIYDA